MLQSIVMIPSLKKRASVRKGGFGLTSVLRKAIQDFKQRYGYVLNNCVGGFIRMQDQSLSTKKAALSKAFEQHFQLSKSTSKEAEHAAIKSEREFIDKMLICFESIHPKGELKKDARRGMVQPAYPAKKEILARYVRKVSDFTQRRDATKSRVSNAKETLTQARASAKSTRVIYDQKHEVYAQSGRELDAIKAQIARTQLRLGALVKEIKVSFEPFKGEYDGYLSLYQLTSTQRDVYQYLRSAKPGEAPDIGDFELVDDFELKRLPEDPDAVIKRVYHKDSGRVMVSLDLTKLPFKPVEKSVESGFALAKRIYEHISALESGDVKEFEGELSIIGTGQDAQHPMVLSIDDALSAAVESMPKINALVKELCKLKKAEREGAAQCEAQLKALKALKPEVDRQETEASQAQDHVWRIEKEFSAFSKELESLQKERVGIDLCVEKMREYLNRCEQSMNASASRLCQLEQDWHNQQRVCEGVAYLSPLVRAFGLTPIEDILKELESSTEFTEYDQQFIADCLGGIDATHVSPLSRDELLATFNYGGFSEYSHPTIINFSRAIALQDVKGECQHFLTPEQVFEIYQSGEPFVIIDPPLRVLEAFKRELKWEEKRLQVILTESYYQGRAGQNLHFEHNTKEHKGMTVGGVPMTKVSLGRGNVVLSAQRCCRVFMYSLAVTTIGTIAFLYAMHEESNA